MAFTPRTAIVTASDSGIGKATAVALAKAGMDIGITWHSDAAGAEQTAEEVRSIGRRATVVPTDVTRRSSVDALAAAALEQHGKIDVWCNIAGVIRYANVVDVTDGQLHTGQRLQATWSQVPATDDCDSDILLLQWRVA